LLESLPATLSGLRVSCRDEQADNETTRLKHVNDCIAGFTR
jgi:hypothetical protein